MKVFESSPCQLSVINARWSTLLFSLSAMSISGDSEALLLVLSETESSTARESFDDECNKDKTFNVLIVSLQLIFFFLFEEKLFATYLGIARLTVAAVDKNSSQARWN